MTFELASRLMLMSAALSITFSSLMGFGMLLITKQLHDNPSSVKVNLRQLGAAHLDWLMLSFMLGIAVMFMHVFELKSIDRWIPIVLIAGSWINPVSYVFRAFGVNSFVFAGGLTQRLSAALGGISSVMIVAAWVALIFQALQ